MSAPSTLPPPPKVNPTVPPAHASVPTAAPTTGATPSMEQLLSGLDTEHSWADWARSYLIQLIVYAAQNPWQLVFIIILVLSPLLLLSAFFSWRLVKHIDSKDKDKKKRAHRQANAARARGRAKAD